MLRRAMAEAGLSEAGEEDLADSVLLLASELCDNATLHAGTEFEVELSITEDEVLVAVTDHGAGPLELYLSQPRPRFGRAATHGRGLMLVAQLATKVVLHPLLYVASRYGKRRGDCLAAPLGLRGDRAVSR